MGKHRHTDEFGAAAETKPKSSRGSGSQVVMVCSDEISYENAGFGVVNFILTRVDTPSGIR